MLEDVHKFSFCNMDFLKNDTFCGCFYCLKIYSTNEIVEWVEEENGGKTAICPYCGIDSVLGESSGYPITRPFLLEMFGKWFGSK